MRFNIKGNRMGKTKSKRGSERRIAVIAVIIVAVLILGLAIGMGTWHQGEVGPDGSSSEPAPGNPRRSATEWLTKLMGRTSGRFGPDMFSGDNAEFKKLMGGDTSFIPKDIRESVRTGTSSDKDMTVTRDMLNGSAYAGLIMYSTAYKNTRDRKVTVPGYAMTSYDETTKTVYIPARAVMLTDQAINFEVTWDGGKWVLEGDPIAWDIYSMLEDSTKTQTGSSGTDGGAK